MTGIIFPKMEPYVARYWEKLDSGKIECRLCPRRCTLREGQRGFCFVRQNIGGELILTTYGRTSGIANDPIEKKPLYHFFPGSRVLSFGTVGCNLGCKFCQNWDISKSRERSRSATPASAEWLANTALEHGCKSVAFTYNDPVIFAEFAMDVADACHELGIRTVAVTAGYIEAKPRMEFFSKMDAANVDLKAFTEHFYKKLTLSSLRPVLDTLQFIYYHTKTWLEITTLIIPGENDSNQGILDLSSWVRRELGTEVPLHFTAFHPDYKMMDHPNTPFSTLRHAYEIAKDVGLHHIYIGNVWNSGAENTYCHHCGTLLIERNGYRAEIHELSNGKCRNCQAPCPGHF